MEFVCRIQIVSDLTNLNDKHIHSLRISHAPWCHYHHTGIVRIDQYVRYIDANNVDNKPRTNSFDLYWHNVSIHYDIRLGGVQIDSYLQDVNDHSAMAICISNMKVIRLGGFVWWTLFVGFGSLRIWRIWIMICEQECTSFYAHIWLQYATYGCTSLHINMIKLTLEI